MHRKPTRMLEHYDVSVKGLRELECWALAGCPSALSLCAFTSISRASDGSPW